MARHSAGWWAERVAELVAGAEPSLIARRCGVTVQLLKWWRWKLEGVTVKRGARRRRPARPREAAPVQRLLPVIVAATGEPQCVPADDRALDASTVIETTRGRITMRGSLSAEQLAVVVAELVRGC